MQLCYVSFKITYDKKCVAFIEVFACLLQCLARQILLFSLEPAFTDVLKLDVYAL